MNKYNLIVFLTGIFIVSVVCNINGAGSSYTPVSGSQQFYNDAWEKGGHSNDDLPNKINRKALTEVNHRGCLVCHAEQRFVEWAKMDFATFNLNSSSFSALPEGKGKAVTCNTCHELESNKTPTHKDPLLRLKGDEPFELMSGFKVKEYLGRGALCMLCHNSAQGAIRDSADTILSSARTPHIGTQADLFMGQNFYFVEEKYSTYHIGSIDNTCTVCHMGSTLLGTKPTDHTFKADFQVCLDCHEGEFDPETVQNELVAEIDVLKKSVGSAVGSFIQIGLDNGQLKLKNIVGRGGEDKDITSFPGGKVSDVVIRYYHGARQAVNLKIDGKSYLTTLDQLESQGVKLMSTAQGQVIAKVGWNVIMLDHDRSGGIHNPSFVYDMIYAALKKLEETDFSVITLLKK
jgi:hypothetical protein